MRGRVSKSTADPTGRTYLDLSCGTVMGNRATGRNGYRNLAILLPRAELVTLFGSVHEAVMCLSHKDLNRAGSGDDLMSDLQPANAVDAQKHPHRFHLPHAHLDSVFGGDWFALKAEEFARFFGTPLFLVAQTVIVAVWIGINVVGWTSFDIYPFILLNLAFSLQAAYAAPLILLAPNTSGGSRQV